MVLYFGNMLSVHGKSPSFIEEIVPKLHKHLDIASYSSKESKLARLFDMIFGFYRDRNRCQLVLIDCYSSTAFWYVVLISALARWYKIPYVPVLHGGDLPTRLKSWPRVSKFVFGNSKTNVSPSLYLQDHFSKAGFKVIFIPNFIELGHYPFRKRGRLQPKLLWVRAFHQIYNPALAIDVLKLLAQRFSNATLCMIGTDKDGSMDEVKNKAAAQGVSHQLEIPGYLSKNDWKRKSKDFDIFINTTNFDNMPVSVVEAMALGLPVVSTNAGGLPYLINDMIDGMLTNRGDAAGFVAAIERLILEPELASRISDNARLKVEGFDWAVVSSQWRNLISMSSRSLPHRSSAAHTQST